MAKAKQRRPHPSDLRWGPVTREELETAAKEFRELAESMDSVAAELDGDPLRVDGVTQLRRGRELVESFVRNTRKALIDAEG